MTQILLLGLIAVGLISARARILDEHAHTALTDLILDVFLPCSILSSFFGTRRSQILSMGIVMAISLGILTISFLLGKYLLYRRAGTEQKKVLLYATIITNASFIGNPVIGSIYGHAALMYAAIYLVPLRIALWTVGLIIFTGGKGNWKKVALHPCLIATYVGIILMLAEIDPPALVQRFVFTIGECATPLSMMVVGCVLGLVKGRDLFSGLTFYFSFIRLILIPLMVVGALAILRPDPVISGVSVILCGTPAAVTTSILAGKYKADNELAGKIIFVSTLLSIVTIPFLVWLLRKAM